MSQSGTRIIDIECRDVLGLPPEKKKVSTGRYRFLGSHSHALSLQDSTLMGHCNTCNSHGPVVVYIAKLFPKPDCSSFDVFGRVFSGSVKAGDKVRVLGQSYSPEDEEDSAVAQVSKVCVFMGRYRIPVTKCMAGGELLPPTCLLTITRRATNSCGPDRHGQRSLHLPSEQLSSLNCYGRIFGTVAM